MANEISLRTNKSEYNSGEEIYGVVYLRISAPTKGTGIRIRFKGYEKFEYEDKSQRVNDLPSVVYTDHRHYINLDEVLYQSDDPLTMCITYFPFKITLPVEIPGTFNAHHDSSEKYWKARVEYKLEAEVIDASRALAISENVTVRQPLSRSLKLTDNPAGVLATYELTRALMFTSIIQVLALVNILQPLPAPCRYEGHPPAYHASHPARYFYILKRNVHITARLLDHIHRTGENARLKIIVTNNSSVPVQTIRLQLQRSITFHTRRKLDEGDERISLHAEVRENVGREQNINMTRFRELERILIPLKDVNNRPLYPSVQGQHITCEYEVYVTVVLGNGDTFDLSVPISVIVAERNKQWDNWMKPGWVTDDSSNIQHSVGSVLRVPENIISSKFSSIPGFV